MTKSLVMNLKTLMLTLRNWITRERKNFQKVSNKIQNLTDFMAKPFKDDLTVYQYLEKNRPEITNKLDQRLEEVGEYLEHKFDLTPLKTVPEMVVENKIISDFAYKEPDSLPKEQQEEFNDFFNSAVENGWDREKDREFLYQVYTQIGTQPKPENNFTQRTMKNVNVLANIVDINRNW